MSCCSKCLMWLAIQRFTGRHLANNTPQCVFTSHACYDRRLNIITSPFRSHTLYALNLWQFESRGAVIAGQFRLISKKETSHIIEGNVSRHPLFVQLTGVLICNTPSVESKRPKTVGDYTRSRLIAFCRGSGSVPSRSLCCKSSVLHFKHVNSMSWCLETSPRFSLRRNITSKDDMIMEESFTIFLVGKLPGATWHRSTRVNDLNDRQMCKVP